MTRRKRERSKHSIDLERMLLHIGEKIPHPRIVCSEPRFYGRRGRLICEPDGVVYDGNNLFLFEYKTHDTPAQRRKAERQLVTARNFVLDQIGLYLPIQRVYAHDENDIEFLDI